MASRSWQQDTAFVAALKARQYIGVEPDGQLRLFLSPGSYIYMHELFEDGKQLALSMAGKVAQRAPGAARG